MTAFLDKIVIESEGAGAFDRFTTLDLTCDMVAPFEAAFEVGDDGTFNELEKFIAHGKKFRVKVNNATQMTGQVILNDSPSDASGGTNVRFTVRSKIHEAMLASADPDIRVKDATLKDVLLKAYLGLGLSESDFVFQQDLARSLATGVKHKSGGDKITKGLEEFTEQSARVAPPESIYQFVDRHLKRFGLLHWDSPDGKIVIGAPNDEQEPTYYFRHLIGKAGAANNVASIQRGLDWSEIPSLLGVFGAGGKSGFRKAKVKALAQDDDVIAAGFYRPVLIISDGIKTQQQAGAAATREMSARRKTKDAWVIKCDSLSYFDSGTRSVYGVDVVCDIVSNLIGGPTGAYYVTKVTHHLSASEGACCELTVIKRGIWNLAGLGTLAGGGILHL